MYDPLHDRFPGAGVGYPDSYWAATVNDRKQFSRLTNHEQFDVVVVGGGYTGLSCALALAESRQVSVAVVEANQIGWGCSGRNAGFVLPSTGRMGFSEMVSRWGDSTMRGMYDEYQQGVERVRQLINQGIDCDQQTAGYLKMAHKPSMLNQLFKQADLIEATFGTPVERLSQGQVHQNYVVDQNAFGAIRFANGFGINPLKLTLGYAELAEKAGATLYDSSPVIELLQTDSNNWRVRTSAGEIKANNVVIATNGYTPKGFHPAVNGRTLPVLSQIIVTQALSDSDIENAGIKTSNVVMDTRALKYYYRKLPDNRLLFGGRGAISGKSAHDPYYAKRLLEVLKSSFPSLQSLSIDYAWSGWISVSLDDIPHIHQSEEFPGLYYGMGYCGSGVSFSAQAGKRLADLVLGKDIPELPMYQKKLPKFPFAPFRRIGQWGYFQYGRIKDSYL